MASPQKENGHTQIANEIIEHIVKRKFAANQLTIILLVIRFTYGFQRKEHNFSIGFVADATGMDKKAAKRAIDSLIEAKVLIVTQEASFTNPRRLAFNKDYERWQIEERGQKKREEAKQPGGGRFDHTPGGESDHTGGGRFDHQERKDKEKINTTTKEQENCFNFYEQNFGIMAPYLIEQVGQWLDDFEEQHDIIIFAMQIALERNKRSWGYIQAILKDWLDNGAKSLQDCEALQNEFNSQAVVKTGAHKKSNQIDWEEV